MWDWLQYGHHAGSWTVPVWNTSLVLPKSAFVDAALYQTDTV